MSDSEWCDDERSTFQPRRITHNININKQKETEEESVFMGTLLKDIAMLNNERIAYLSSQSRERYVVFNYDDTWLQYIDINNNNNNNECDDSNASSDFDDFDPVHFDKFIYN